MAKKISIKDFEGMKWGKGEYSTDTGGGTPLGMDKSHPEAKGRGAWGRRTAKSGDHREDEQPRDKNGQFTYNSMIGKELKDISKSHGRSRGTTIPPMFNNGANGDSMDPNHKTSSGKKSYENYDEFMEVWEKWSENGWYGEKGSEIALRENKKTSIKIAPDAMWLIGQEWIVDKSNGQAKLVDKVAVYDKDVLDDNGNVIHKKGEKFIYKSAAKSNKGEFGRRWRGEEETTGDISKWENKVGRRSKSEKEAAKGLRKGKFNFVKAEGQELADATGNKVSGQGKSWEEKIADVEADRSARGEARRIEAGLRKEFENIGKGKAKKTEGENKPAEKKVSDPIETFRNNIATAQDEKDFDNLVNDVVDNISEEEKAVLFEKLGVKDEKDLSGKLLTGDIDDLEVEDILKSVVNPGDPDYGK